MLALWVTPASLDWMESMAFQVPQDYQDHLVQAQLKETGVTPGSQASPAPLAEKENLEAQEAPELLVLLDLKEKEGRAVTMGVLVSRVTLVTLVTTGTKEPRDSEDLPVGRVSQE